MSGALLTGATGFIGRRLCEALSLRTPRIFAATRDKESTVLPASVMPVVVRDIGPRTDWRPVFHTACRHGHEFDTVIHLAARVHVLRERAANPLEEFRRVNVEGTLALARAAVGRVRRFVYISSLHAMGTLADELLTENSPCRPDTPYGQSKLEAEQGLRELAAREGLDVVILRPPPVYGPGAAGNLTSLLRWIERGWPLPLASVQNRRSLISVNNLVDAIVACAENPAAAGQTFLVSDGEDLSIAELVRRAAEALGTPPRLVPMSPALLRLAGRCTGKSSSIERLLGSLAVDTSHIRRTLGWHPPETLAQGLAATARWIRETSSSPNQGKARSKAA